MAAAGTCAGRPRCGRTPTVAYLISIKDADELVGRDGGAGRVQVGEAVVQVGRLSVHLPHRPPAAADIDNLRPHLLTPAHHAVPKLNC